eukprot:CAMPEP_0196652302 /NCGR_PEP_ID=MMETSP1086-20130531/1534_1 /TAXON_ID=77921 /ORGANISM="Cyanoptyche  gloeocystis , Strain SAG4.97" /LENGTH=123 /DNA_ID=CAMNT_0041982763 /DNA_START=33 /DNA_END=404 /DNA_ORIENTATION=-
MSFKAKKTDEPDELPKWRKALTRNSEWEKNDLADAVGWFRQILALMCGLIWGIIPIKGAIGILSFLGVNVASTFVYYSQFLGVDEEDVMGSRWVLLQEDLFPSFATFLLLWTLMHTFLYYPSG